MRYTQVTNAKFANSEGTSINCWVKFDAFSNPVPFTASSDDVEAHSRRIYEELLEGTHGAISEYTKT